MAKLYPNPLHVFGNYILSSRIHAIGVISLTSIVSFYMSSIMLALTVLRRGGKFGLHVIAGCMVFIVLVLSLLNKVPFTDVLIIILRTWVPVWCCAMVLRKTESQAAMTLMAGAFGTLFIVLMYLLIDDVPLWWQTWFNHFLDALVKSGVTTDATTRVDQLKSDLAQIAPVINPLIMSFLVIWVVTVILIGRWWQSRLFYPGAFRKEFYALQLPRSLIYLALLGITVLVLGNASKLLPVRDLLWLTIIMFLFQGLSSVHRLVQRKNYSSAWLVAMYSFLIILFPHMIVFIACIGMADAWIRGRKTANS